MYNLNGVKPHGHYYSPKELRMIQQNSQCQVWETLLQIVSQGSLKDPQSNIDYRLCPCLPTRA